MLSYVRVTPPHMVCRCAGTETKICFAAPYSACVIKLVHRFCALDWLSALGRVEEGDFLFYLERRCHLQDRTAEISKRRELTISVRG